jgi:hypothetical protein
MNQRACCIVLSVLVLSLPAFAQERDDLNTGVESSATGTNRVGLAITAAGSQQFNSDIDHGGAFSLFRGRIGAAIPVRLSDTMRWDTTVKYQFDAYSFSKQVDPWGTINTLQPTTMLKVRVSDKVGVYGGATFRFAVEDSTDLGKGFTAGGLVGCNYAINSNLTVGAGLAYVGQIENDSKILPIVTVNWQIADNMLLTAGFLDVATAGYGAEFSYVVAPKWLVSVGAQYHNCRFRLDPNSSVAPDGVGQESSGTWFVRGTWQATPFVSASAFAGIVAGGGLRVENNVGRKLFDNNYDTTGMAGGEVSVRF